MKPSEAAADRSAREVLGVSASSGAQEIRAAYLRKVREHPPDRDPREFERVRDAYEHLKDPHRKRSDAVLAADPMAPMANLLTEGDGDLRHVGPEPWLAVLKESEP